MQAQSLNLLHLPPVLLLKMSSFTNLAALVWSVVIAAAVAVAVMWWWLRSWSVAAGPVDDVEQAGSSTEPDPAPYLLWLYLHYCSHPNM